MNVPGQGHPMASLLTSLLPKKSIRILVQIVTDYNQHRLTCDLPRSIACILAILGPPHVHASRQARCSPNPPSGQPGKDELRSVAVPYQSANFSSHQVWLLELWCKIHIDSQSQATGILPGDLETLESWHHPDAKQSAIT